MAWTKGVCRALPPAWIAVTIYWMVLPGCDGYFERRELEREQRQLQTRRAQLEQTLQRETGGRPPATEQQKARVGPIAVELRGVENRLAEIDTRLRELD